MSRSSSGLVAGRPASSPLQAASPLPVRLSAAIGATLAVAAWSAPAFAAPAAATGWDAGACGALTIGGRVGGGPGRHRIEDFSARLARPGAPDDPAGHLHATELRTAGPGSLDGLPGLFAGGALIGMEENRPHGCDLTHAFRTAAITLASLPRGATAEQRWSGIRATAGANDAAIATLRLRMENVGADDLTRVTEDASGISTDPAGHDTAPVGSMSLSVSAPRARLAAIAAGGEMLPSDTVTIERLVVHSGDAVIEARGTVHPATRSGRIVLHAQDMEALKAAMPPAEREKFGAGLLVMRLAADRDPDGSLRWDVVWEDNLVTINGVPLPTAF